MNKLLCCLSFSSLALLQTAEAHADIVMVVSAKSPASNLNRDQVEDIYRLRMRELPGGAPIAPLMQTKGPEKDEFLAKVLGTTDAQMKGYWAKYTFTGKGVPPREVPTDAEMKALIAANPNLIGYINSNAVDASVKVLLKP